MAKSYVPVCVLCLGVFIKCSMAEISNDIDVPTRYFLILYFIVFSTFLIIMYVIRNTRSSRAGTGTLRIEDFRIMWLLYYVRSWSSFLFFVGRRRLKFELCQLTEIRISKSSSKTKRKTNLQLFQFFPTTIAKLTKSWEIGGVFPLKIQISRSLS